MSSSTRSRRRKTLILAVSATLALTGVAVGFGARPARSDAAVFATGAPIPVPPTLTGGVAGARDPVLSDAPGSADRRTVFFARVAALRPLQDALRRAFAPPFPPPSAHTPVRTARLARGGTAEACLTQAVYYEARGEPAEGQAAVAQVVLNRSRSRRHPSGLCDVVFEGAARPGCQFSFACDARLAHGRVDPAAWRRAQQAAAAALAGHGRPDLETALNYHADYVRPRWAAQLQRTAEIGRHIFYASTRPIARALQGWTFAPAAPAATPDATPAA